MQYLAAFVTIVPCVFIAVAAVADAKAPLFVIERSKNANVVVYDAKLDAKGALDQEEPVVAYWKLLAEDGRVEELSFLERTQAYGFEVEDADEPGVYLLTLVPCEDRDIKVSVKGGVATAETVIDGAPAVFKKLYVKTNESGVLPSVEYIELFGKDVQSGSPRYEKLVP